MESQASELKKRLELEIVKLRRSGVVLPSLEAKLAQAVNELKPRLRFDSTRDRLFNLEATSYIDTAVPTESKKPGVAYVKRAIKASVGWYFTYITQQVNNFNFEVVGLLNALELRLVEQERRLARIAPELELRTVRDHFPADEQADEVVLEILAHSPFTRPILVTEAGADQLLARLEQRHQDLAYGLEEDPALADDGATQGLDIRNHALLWHLEHCGDASLDAIVARGVALECSPVWFKRVVLTEIARTLTPDGCALLIHHEPTILTQSPALTAVAAIRGAPISTEAWHLLAHDAGFDPTTTKIDDHTSLTRLGR